MSTLLTPGYGSTAILVDSSRLPCGARCVNSPSANSMPTVTGVTPRPRRNRTVTILPNRLKLSITNTNANSEVPVMEAL